MLVIKFGGTSLGTPDRVRQAVGIVRDAARNQAGGPVLVVCSAFATVTDALLDAADRARAEGVVHVSAIRERHREMADGLGVSLESVEPLLAELSRWLEGVALLQELTPRARDAIASIGERGAVRLIAAVARAEGLPADFRDAFNLGILTDDTHGEARPLPDAPEAIRRAWGDTAKTIGPGGAVFVTGFIGKNRRGDITTFGRNGSDYSATVFGAALGAAEVQIWTDVDGVLTADPRIVPQAKLLTHLGFMEAGELSHYGARVLHPATLAPAMERAIPVRVCNTEKPSGSGTTILAERPDDLGLPQAAQSIVYKTGQYVVTVTTPLMQGRPGLLSQVTTILAAHGIAINLVATSEVSTSMTVEGTTPPERLNDAIRELDRFTRTTLLPDRAIVGIVGQAIPRTPGFAGDALGAFRDAGIPLDLISYGGSRINLTVVIPDAAVPNAVKALHAKFFERKS